MALTVEDDANHSDAYPASLIAAFCVLSGGQDMNRCTRVHASQALCFARQTCHPHTFFISPIVDYTFSQPICL